MKANELRIGNLIIESLSFGSDKIIKVDSNIFNRRIDDFIPIPLTKEWLLKFGFDKSNVYCFGNHKLIIESLMGDRHSCRYRINPNESIWISELHYVHQLQNLYFALTGEELTFKSE